MQPFQSGSSKAGGKKGQNERNESFHLGGFLGPNQSCPCIDVQKGEIIHAKS